MIQVIGAGLAGCEAAWQIAEAGEEAELIEMKPARYSPAHKSPLFAELICSNSLKAARIESAAGLLKEEMRRLGSLLVECAQSCAVPAGGALAVDRGAFSSLVTKRVREHPRIHVREGVEVRELPLEGIAIVATGRISDGPRQAAPGVRSESRERASEDRRGDRQKTPIHPLPPRKFHRPKRHLRHAAKSGENLKSPLRERRGCGFLL